MKTIPRDVSLFAVGSEVTVPSVEGYERVVIQRISDSGVTVKGQHIGSNVVISGRTPAIPFDREAAELKEKEDMEKENLDDSPNEENHLRAKRGSIKAKMAALKIPSNPFTVKQLAVLNNIPDSYANKWLKDNARQIGNVEKVAGQRGKAAFLFEM